MRVDARPATSRGFIPGCHSTTPCPSTSSPRRPARPVSWVYSPGVMSACVSPFHLLSFSITTVRAGMLMPSARVSVANTTLQSPRTKSASTTCLNAGSMPAWWAAIPRLRRVQEVVVAEDDQVVVGEVATGTLDIGEDLVALLRGGEPHPGVEALGHGGVAAHPAEDEHDGREQTFTVQPVDDVGTARDPDPASVADVATPCAGVLGRARSALVAGRPAVAHEPLAGPVVAGDPAPARR